VIYSDLGFITLGKLLERLTGLALNVIAKREIFELLKLRHTFFNPDYELQSDIAACEEGNAYESAMCENLGSSDRGQSRRRLIWGEVHDGNAYFLGGVAGHAGLFSTASETMQLAQQFLANQTRTLKPESCLMFRMNMTDGLEEARSIAWQLALTKESTAGPSLPRDSFGHAGFTGTSCWVDPHNDRVFVLLTNRTHARKLPFANINQVRRQFHTLAVQELSNRSS
jgi:CubicO group peptidase (beta-lactamase class C family)